MQNQTDKKKEQTSAGAAVDVGVNNQQKDASNEFGVKLKETHRRRNYSLGTRVFKCLDFFPKHFKSFLILSDPFQKNRNN